MSLNTDSNKFKHTLITVTAVLSLVAVFGVFHYSPDVAASQEFAPAADAPLSVEVVTLQPQSVRLWSEFSGRLAAVNHVDVRPRVSGTIQQVLFEDGQLVQAGDPLYVIDPRPYEAGVASAEAELASANSHARLAKVELERAQGLVTRKLISQSDFDIRKNDCKVASARIKAAEADLQQARLSLEYAHISAPVSGRVSRAEITVGNVVQAGPSAPVLTTIVSNDRLYAEFEVDEQTYVKFVRQSGGGVDMPVELTLASDTSVIYRGKMHAFDNSLDTRSGTIRARAIFDNTDGALVSGMYANVRLGAAASNNVILLSERALGTDQDRKFVYVVDSQGKVEYREVKIGRSVNGQRLVLAGLSAGDQVIVNGLHRVRPDMTVVPVSTEGKQLAHR